VCDQPTTRPAAPAPAAVVAEHVAKLRALRNQPESEDA